MRFAFKKRIQMVLVFACEFCFFMQICNGEFTRKANYESVDAFLKAAKAFQPVKTHDDLSAVFAVKELGEGDRAGKLVYAETIAGCESLWSDDSYALVFATAQPKTEATSSMVGVLFLLTHQEKGWFVSDLVRFNATGKYANVSAKLTAFTGTGYQLGETELPVITIEESQGGRGYSYALSASYSFDKGKIKRMDLN